MAQHKPPKVLLVENDPKTVERIVELLARHLDAHLTCVACGPDALDLDLVEPHDVLIAEANLPGMDGVTLARQVLELRERPVILLSNDPHLAQAVDALRAGVTDFLVKPFEPEHLVSTLQRALRQAAEHRRLVQRHHRLRALVRRVIRDRRELNSRIDLICRDLVGAHRRLVHRVIDQELLPH